MQHAESQLIQFNSVQFYVCILRMCKRFGDSGKVKLPTNRKNQAQREATIFQNWLGWVDEDSDQW